MPLTTNPNDPYDLERFWARLLGPPPKFYVKRDLGDRSDYYVGAVRVNEDDPLTVTWASSIEEASCWLGPYGRESARVVAEYIRDPLAEVEAVYTP